MSLLNDLANLLHHHSQQPQHGGNQPVPHQQIKPGAHNPVQQPGGMQLQGPPQQGQQPQHFYEDDQYVNDARPSSPLGAQPLWALPAGVPFSQIPGPGRMFGQNVQPLQQSSFTQDYFQRSPHSRIKPVRNINANDFQQPNFNSNELLDPSSRWF